MRAMNRLVPVLVAGLLLVGCDGDEGRTGGGDEAATITATGLEPFDGPASVAAGEVTLRFVNEDAVGHNLTIEELGEATETIGEGEEADLAVALEAGESYTLFCSISGHRDAGMELTVTAE